MLTLLPTRFLNFNLYFLFTMWNCGGRLNSGLFLTADLSTVSNNIKNYFVTSNVLPFIIFFQIASYEVCNILSQQLNEFNSYISWKCSTCFPFSLYQTSIKGDIHFLIFNYYCCFCRLLLHLLSKFIPVVLTNMEFAKALLVSLIWVTLLLWSSPNNNSDSAGTFLVSCLILASNLDFRISLLNWFK